MAVTAEPSSRRRAVVVVVTGPPGTGKSTIAEHAAVHLGATLLAWDWLVAGLAMLPPMASALDALDRPVYRDAGWSGLWNLAELQLRTGQPVVLDGVAREAELERAARLAGDHRVPLLSIGTRCSDLALHEARLTARRRDIPGWHDLEWPYVTRFLATWSEPRTTAVLDAVHPLEDNLRAVSRWLDGLGDPQLTDSAIRNPIA